jgi:putative two-component system response regulator
LNFTDRYENWVSNSYVDAVELAAAVHDIGKLSVPKELLTKKGKLTDEEWEILKRHTVTGYDIIKAAYADVERNHYIKLATEVVRYHHENWDGSGYPDRLVGEDIPLSARIVRIVDTYDSILSERVYRKAHSKEEALGYMKEGRGTKFDPYILDVFLKVEKQMKGPQ